MGPPVAALVGVAQVMNPDKMRDTHGKLMYMLMDSAEPEVRAAAGQEMGQKGQGERTWVGGWQGRAAGQARGRGRSSGGWW